MKKLIWTLLASLAVFTASAQEKTDKLSWMVRGGVNLSTIENSALQNKFGWKIGTGVEYSFSEKFSLNPMLYYSTKGASMGDNTMGFGNDVTHKLNYLELPILAAYRFKVGATHSISAKLGPYFSTLLSRTAPAGTEEFNKFDMGVEIGADYNFKRFIIGLSGQYGLTGLSKADPSQLHNINYSLSVGYRF